MLSLKLEFDVDEQITRVPIGEIVEALEATANRLATGPSEDELELQGRAIATANFLSHMAADEKATLDHNEIAEIAELLVRLTGDERAISQVMANLTGKDPF